MFPKNVHPSPRKSTITSTYTSGIRLNFLRSPTIHANNDPHFLKFHCFRFVTVYENAEQMNENLQRIQSFRLSINWVQSCSQPLNSSLINALQIEKVCSCFLFQILLSVISMFACKDNLFNALVGNFFCIFQHIFQIASEYRVPGNRTIHYTYNASVLNFETRDPTDRTDIKIGFNFTRMDFTKIIWSNRWDSRNFNFSVAPSQIDAIRFCQFVGFCLTPNAATNALDLCFVVLVDLILSHYHY